MQISVVQTNIIIVTHQLAQSTPQHLRATTKFIRPQTPRPHMKIDTAATATCIRHLKLIWFNHNVQDIGTTQPDVMKNHHHRVATPD
jgi:hypothetical protein